MRLFILGANGKTGTQLVDLALARNHQVTAFVRSPEKITRRHPNLQVLHGDPATCMRWQGSSRDTMPCFRRWAFAHLRRSARTHSSRSVPPARWVQ